MTSESGLTQRHDVGRLRRVETKCNIASQASSFRLRSRLGEACWRHPSVLEASGKQYQRLSSLASAFISPSSLRQGFLDISPTQRPRPRFPCELAVLHRQVARRVMTVMLCRCRPFRVDGRQVMLVGLGNGPSREPWPRISQSRIVKVDPSIESVQGQSLHLSFAGAYVGTVGHAAHSQTPWRDAARSCSKCGVGQLIRVPPPKGKHRFRRSSLMRALEHHTTGRRKSDCLPHCCVHGLSYRHRRCSFHALESSYGRGKFIMIEVFFDVPNRCCRQMVSFSSQHAPTPSPRHPPPARFALAGLGRGTTTVAW